MIIDQFLLLPEAIQVVILAILITGVIAVLGKLKLLSFTFWGMVALGLLVFLYAGVVSAVDLLSNPHWLFYWIGRGTVVLLIGIVLYYITGGYRNPDKPPYPPSVQL